jgi:predicted PurR-regulated permease PerM
MGVHIMFDFLNDIETGEMVYLILIGIVLFFLVREINCWYWKINNMVDRLENIENLLKEQGDGINNKLTNIYENGIKIIKDPETNDGDAWVDDIIIK